MDRIFLVYLCSPLPSRSLLLPKPLKEIRVKGQYDEFKEIPAAQGVKIAARDLEKAIAGLNLQVAYHDDEVELLKEEVDKEFKAAMRSIKVGILFMIIVGLGFQLNLLLQILYAISEIR